ncbi:MAG TPA: hypothetical protein ENI23_17670 [bacterium]|nr:hypothetical protein [bacterium]
MSDTVRVTELFPSFQVIAENILTVMLAPPLQFNDYLYPIFGCRKFPIDYHSNLDKTSAWMLLHVICRKSESLDFFDIQAYHQWLINTGNVASGFVPMTLSGECVKSSDNEIVSARCRVTVTNKWGCKGCGKIYIPGSYDSKSCVQHPEPFWLASVKDVVAADIKDYGGISKKAPLVWTKDKTFRPFVES